MNGEADVWVGPLCFPDYTAVRNALMLLPGVRKRGSAIVGEHTYLHVCYDPELATREMLMDVVKAAKGEK